MYYTACFVSVRDLCGFFVLSTLCHPPPRSTLFPYTTLFRSISTVLSKMTQLVKSPVYFTCFSCSSNAFSYMTPPFANRDRKSTRLNSSHLGISYAVFCLKNNTPRRPLTRNGLCTHGLPRPPS